MQLDLIAQYNHKTHAGKKTKPKKKDEQLVLDADHRESTSAHDDMVHALGSEVSDSMHSLDEEEADVLINGSAGPVDGNIIDDNITMDSIINEDYCEEETVPQLPPIDSKLKPVRINDLLYKKLNFHYKVNDQHL